MRRSGNRDIDTESASAVSAPGLAAGDRVSHPTRGGGEVIFLAAGITSVRFDNGEVKTYKQASSHKLTRDHAGFRAKHKRGAWIMAKRAREDLEKITSNDPVNELGGCARAAMTFTLSKMDLDGDGAFAPEDLENAKRLVNSTKDELLTAGVVAALVLSIMYELAYQEKDVLLHLIQSQDAGDEEYDWADFSDISSFVATQVAVSCAFITLWYVAMSVTAEKWVDRIKRLTVYASLITLALETAVTGRPIDLLALVPLAAVACAMTLLHGTLSRECKEFLNGDLIALKDKAPPVEVVDDDEPSTSPVALDPTVQEKLQHYLLEPEKLRPYANDITLHPFLDQVLQHAGILDVGTRFRAIEALRGAETTPTQNRAGVGQATARPKLAPPSKQYLERKKSAVS